MTILVIKRVIFLFECMAGFVCPSVMIAKERFYVLMYFCTGFK